MRHYPVESYPTVVEGYVSGDKLRLESLEAPEKILRPGDSPNPLQLMHDGKGWRLKNFGPVVFQGKLYAVTHLQKYSASGWLKTSPDCFHRWWFWEPQQQVMDAEGVWDWKAGTERGIYFRKPFSWRWDVAGTVLEGALRHFVWTKGYLGGHWD